MWERPPGPWLPGSLSPPPPPPPLRPVGPPSLPPPTTLPPPPPRSPSLSLSLLPSCLGRVELLLQPVLHTHTHTHARTHARTDPDQMPGVIYIYITCTPPQRQAVRRMSLVQATPPHTHPTPPPLSLAHARARTWRARGRVSAERAATVNVRTRCVRLQHQFFLVTQTNCKHLHSFLGPYLDSCESRRVGIRRIPSDQPPHHQTASIATASRHARASAPRARAPPLLYFHRGRNSGRLPPHMM